MSCVDTIVKYKLERVSQAIVDELVTRNRYTNLDEFARSRVRRMLIAYQSYSARLNLTLRNANDKGMTLRNSIERLNDKVRKSYRESDSPFVAYISDESQFSENSFNHADRFGIDDNMLPVIANLIDEELAHNTLESDLYVYRGISIVGLRTLVGKVSTHENEHIVSEMFQPGSIYQDMAFTSTSTSPGLALNFAGNEPKDYSYSLNEKDSSLRGWVLKYRLKRGQHYLAVGSSLTAEYADECEVILPRGQRFKVIDIDTDKHIITLEAEEHENDETTA